MRETLSGKDRVMGRPGGLAAMGSGGAVILVEKCMGTGLVLAFSFCWRWREGERPGRRLLQALSRWQIRAIQWFVGESVGWKEDALQGSGQ